MHSDGVIPPKVVIGAGHYAYNIEKAHSIYLLKIPYIALQIKDRQLHYRIYNSYRPEIIDS